MGRHGGGERPGVGNRPALGDRGRDVRVQAGNRYNNVFAPGRWGRHPGPHRTAHWHPWHHRHWQNRPHYWWRCAASPAVTGWIAWTWPEPIYYTYVPDSYVYCENNVVYVDGKETCSEEEYAEQAANIAGSVPEIKEDQQTHGNHR